MSQVFRCISRWRATKGTEYNVEVLSMTFDSKGHMILMCRADVKPKGQNIIDTQPTQPEQEDSK